MKLWINVSSITGVDKFLSRHQTFRARNFTCAPNQARKKWVVKPKCMSNRDTTRNKTFFSWSPKQILKKKIIRKNDSEKKLIFNATIKLQFSYCPLVWMFCSRQTYNMINELHERALRFVFNDYVSDFEALLCKSNDISCHHRNTQMLMVELYKIKNEFAPPIMKSKLNRRNIIYNFRNLQEFQSGRTASSWNPSYRAPQRWTLLPEEIKQRNTITPFKSDLKQWICKKCPCTLCKVFVPNLRFIWHMATVLVLFTIKFFLFFIK